MLKRNLSALFVIQALRWFLLILPILVPFYQDNGLSLAQVFYLQVAFALVVVFTEIPSGYLADIWGRKLSIVWGSVLSTLGFLLYSLGFSFWHFLAAELFLALGAGLVSGADSALIYDTLKQKHQETSYSLYEGRYIAVGNFSEGIAAVLGGILAFYWMRLPFIFQFTFTAITIPLALLLQEPQREQMTISPKERRTFLFKIIRQSLWQDKHLRWTIFLSAGFSAATLHIVWLIQPYFSLVKIPIYLFGVLWAILQFSVGFFSWNAWRFKQMFSTHTLMLFLTFLLLISYVVPALFINRFTIVFFLLAYLVRGVNAPILRDAINRQTGSDIRATVLSVKSMLVRLIFSFTGPIGGKIADHNLSWSFLFGGIFFFLLIFFFESKLNNMQKRNLK